MRARAIAVLLAVAACAMPGPAPTCSPCKGACVDLKADSQNCGACGLACPAGKRCELGVCASTCPDLACGGECVDAQHDPDNCGGCGIVCNPRNAAAVCQEGRCSHAPCDDGWFDCDFDERNGCETQSSNCVNEICGFNGTINLHCSVQGMSADGRRVLLLSSDGLVSDDRNTQPDVYLYEASTRQLQWLSRPAGGPGVTGQAPPTAAISGDGNRVAFKIFASLLPGGDENLLHLYVLDLTTGQLVDLPLTLSGIGENFLSLSYDGRFLAGDCGTNCIARVDLQSGQAVTWKGEDLAANGAAMSADGRVLAASELLPVEDGGFWFAALTKDLDAGTVRPVIEPTPLGGDGLLPQMVLSFDGARFVAELQLSVIVGDGMDGGIVGNRPSLSYDGRILAWNDRLGGCPVIDRDTGAPVLLSFSYPGCTPHLSGDGRVAALETPGGFILLVHVNRP